MSTVEMLDIDPYGGHDLVEYRQAAGQYRANRFFVKDTLKWDAGDAEFLLPLSKVRGKAYSTIGNDLADQWWLTNWACASSVCGQRTTNINGWIDGLSALYISGRMICWRKSND